MGCHTWFSYKLETQPTYEEVREGYLSFLTKEMGYYERHLSDTLEEREEFLFENETKEKSLHYLSILKRMYRRVEKRLCKLATCRHIQDAWNLDFSERTHSFYKPIKGWHDVFRIGKYPTDELLSLEETLEFIDKNNKIYWSNSKEEGIQRIKEFWDKYPNGRITFG